VRDDSLPHCLRVPRPSRSDTRTTPFSVLQSPPRDPSSTDCVLPLRPVTQCGGRKRERERRFSSRNQGCSPSPSPPPSRCESSRTEGVDILPLKPRQKAQRFGWKQEREERPQECENGDAPVLPPPPRSPPRATASPGLPPLRFVFTQTANNDVAYSHIKAPHQNGAPLTEELDPFVLSSLCPGRLEYSSNDLRPHRDSALPLNARQLAHRIHRGRALQRTERRPYHHKIVPRTSSGDARCFLPPTQSSFPTTNGSPPRVNTSPKIPPLRLIFTSTTHSDADSSAGAPRVDRAMLRYNLDPFVLSSFCPGQPECSPGDDQPHHDPTLPLSARQIAQRVRRRRELQKSEKGLYHREIAPCTSSDPPSFQPPLQCSFPTRNGSPPRDSASPGIPPLRFITPTTQNDAAHSHAEAPPSNDTSPGDDDMDLFVLSSLCPSQPESPTGEPTASPPSARHIAQRTRRKRELQQRERGGLAALRRHDGASFVWRYTFFPPAASASSELSPHKGRWTL
jgi:hypothetical protein